jgi:hypothetical protein
MITPTQLIYQAWRNTPQPIPLPNGKNLVYPEQEYTDIPDPVCWLCGGETNGRGRPHKDIIRKTFTNTPYARAVESNSLCVGCSWVLSHRHFRNYSILVLDGILEHPSRQRIRDILLKPPDRFPWFLSIAVSGQVHISFPGYINFSLRDMRVLMERLMIPIPAKGIADVLPLVEELYSAGFAKEEIQTGNYRQDRIIKAGLAWWREREERLMPMRKGRLFDLAVFVAQKREDDDLSSTVSTPQTNTQPRPRSVSTPSTAAATLKGSKSPRISGESSNERSDQRQSAQQLSLFG